MTTNTLIRLRTQLKGRNLSFCLKNVPATIGATETNDFVVNVDGVSRQHAMIECDNDGNFVVADVGSKNGTFVNGQRVQRHIIRPGDTVHFGQQAVVVEQIETDEADLGISYPSQRPVSAVRDPKGKTVSQGSQSGPSGSVAMAVVEAIAERVLPPENDSVSAALQALVEHGAAGAAVLSGAGCDVDPVIVSSAGELLAEPYLVDAFKLIRSATAEPGCKVLRVGVKTTPPALMLAPARANPGTALIIHGWPPELLTDCLFQHVVLRLLLGAAEGSASSATSTAPLNDIELRFPPGYVVGRSPVAGDLHRELGCLIGTDLPVLIVGETGVGKELVAQTFYRSSARSQQGAFVAVNCAAVPADLLEAELFGIKAGAATGVAPRPGKIRLANGGVLFLDEIGEMPNSLQAKLLRVLQEREVEPLGASRPTPVDIQVLSATNCDLERMVAGGSFRSDLYYRLAGFTVRVPPLRERPGDIQPLLDHFLRAAMNDLGKEIRGVSVKALRALVDAPWPGNVRQLQHVARALVHRCPAGGAIEFSDLPAEIVVVSADETRAGPREDRTELSLVERVQAFERQIISTELVQSRYNRSRAAHALGISRTGLLKKMKRLGLSE